MSSLLSGLLLWHFFFLTFHSGSSNFKISFMLLVDRPDFDGRERKWWGWRCCLYLKMTRRGRKRLSMQTILESYPCPLFHSFCNPLLLEVGHLNMREFSESFASFHLNLKKIKMSIFLRNILLILSHKFFRKHLEQPRAWLSSWICWFHQNNQTTRFTKIHM